MEGVSRSPHAVVMPAGAVIVGNVAGDTVIVLETGASALPHASVAVHVSVIVPPQADGVAENVEGLEVPVIRHPPVNELVKVRVDAAGIAPHAIVITAGAVIVGRADGFIVIIWVKTSLELVHLSLATNVFVYVPPQPVPTKAPEVFVLDNTKQLSAAVGLSACAAVRPAASVHSRVLSILPAALDHVGAI